MVGEKGPWEGPVFRSHCPAFLQNNFASVIEPAQTSGPGSVGWIIVRPGV